MSSWQSIESIPMDGTPVLVWLPDDGSFRRSQVQVANYHPNCKIVGNVFAFDLRKQPTHWMPCPEGPRMETRVANEKEVTPLCNCGEFCAMSLYGSPQNGGTCRRIADGKPVRVAGETPPAPKCNHTLDQGTTLVGVMPDLKCGICDHVPALNRSAEQERS